VSGLRRSTNVAAPDFGLNYAAIGATTSDVVLSFPPEGFRSTQVRHRLGSGTHRFDQAGRALMTWGALRGAGIEVSGVQAEQAAASLRETGPLFLEDGTPWITAGMTASLAVQDGGFPLDGPVKVVTVVDEPGRIGFAWGTCPGNGLQAEQLLLVEHEEDDSVWATIRTICRVEGLRGRSPRLRRAQERLERRLVTALHPARAV
jgi:uncharacterized protein (UPF0548 family)